MSRIDQLVGNAYEQLRVLARKIRTNNVFKEHDTTSLVHEAYLRLSKNQEINLNDPDHFVAVAAVTMRRLIIDLARKHQATKRGGKVAHVAIDNNVPEATGSSSDLLDLDEALGRLASFDQRKCQVVELRFFGGCNVEQTAKALKISAATVAREWDLARAWIYRELKTD